MAELARVLDRVRKLLALATSSNPHEAALAAARAVELIDAYRLASLLAEEVAQPITDGRDDPLERAKRPRKWRSALASALAEVNGCVAWSCLRGGETELYILGRAEDRAMVRALWDWLAPRIEWLSATHGAGRDRRWHEAFRVGAVQTIARRLRDPAAADTPGLVRVQQDLVARRAAVEAYAAEHLGLGRGRGLRLDARAYAQGCAAGEGIALPTHHDPEF